MTTTTKSAGHITFVEGFEWIEEGDDLIRAPISAAFDVTTGNRIGRWEGSLEAARRFPALFPFLPPAADVSTARAQLSL